jgi:hypothetical protein
MKHCALLERYTVDMAVAKDVPAVAAEIVLHWTLRCGEEGCRLRDCTHSAADAALTWMNGAAVAAGGNCWAA